MRTRSEAISLAKAIGWKVLGIVLLCYIFAAGFNFFTFPGEQAQIEQLRRDVQQVDPSNAHDIYGLAAQANQVIASKKRYNHIWWSALLIPDGWDSVELIYIPQKSRQVIY